MLQPSDESGFSCPGSPQKHEFAAICVGEIPVRGIVEERIEEKRFVVFGRRFTNRLASLDDDVLSVARRAHELSHHSKRSQVGSSIKGLTASGTSM
jgi:hypothetical protein